MIGDTTASPTAARQEAAIRSRLVLVRNARSEAILLVEGPTDVPFWRLVGREKVFLIQCDGREAVLKELRAVHAGGAIPGLLAVIDADWDHIEGTRHDLPDLFKTDTRDLESLLVLCTRALEEVIWLHADPDARSALEASEGADLRALLLERARIFGRLRWVHLRRRCTSEFHDGLMNDYFNPKTWRVDEAGLLKALVGLGVAPDAATLRDELAALPEVQDAWLCRGHDLLILLARALSGPLKRAGQKRPPGQDNLRDALSLVAVRSDELYATRLFRELRAWANQDQNRRYNFL